MNHVAIDYIEITEISNSELTRRKILKGVDVVESVAMDDFMKDVINVLKGEIKNGMSINRLSDILKKQFGIAKNCISDVIEWLKIELDLYCPDQVHLYFVNT